MKDISSPKEAAGIVRSLKQDYNARLSFYQTNAPHLIRKVILDLTNERTRGNPEEIKFNFTGIYVADATDTASKVEIIPYAESYANEGFPLTKKDTFDFNYPITKAHIINEAQSGKTITLIFFIEGKFSPGSTLSEIESAVESSALESKTALTVTSAAFTAIAAQNLNRKVANFYTDQDILIASGTGITDANAYLISAGSYFKFKTTAAIYAKAVGANADVRFLEES